MCSTNNLTFTLKKLLKTYIWRTLLKGFFDFFSPRKLKFADKVLSQKCGDLSLDFVFTELLFLFDCVNLHNWVGMCCPLNMILTIFSNCDRTSTRILWYSNKILVPLLLLLWNKVHLNVSAMVVTICFDDSLFCLSEICKRTRARNPASYAG